MDHSTGIRIQIFSSKIKFVTIIKIQLKKIYIRTKL